MQCAPSEKIPEVSSGRVERLASFSSKYVSPRHVDIWLPEGYSIQRSYPVIYMHDGQMLYDSTTTWNGQAWEVDRVLGRLIDQGKIEPCIVVGIWNVAGERWSDYYPQKPFEALPKEWQQKLFEADRNEKPLLNKKLSSDNYLRFIVEELQPVIEARYTLRPGSENQFIMGSSMGGLISMYALAEYPEVFGGAACLSTHWVGSFEQNDVVPLAFACYLNAKLPKLSGKRLYFDYGTATLDTLYEHHQERIDGLIEPNTELKIAYQSLKFEGADHSEKSWAKRLAIPVKFLLEK